MIYFLKFVLIRGYFWFIQSYKDIIVKLYLKNHNLIVIYDRFAAICHLSS